MLVVGLVSTAIGQPAGFILNEYWFDIGGVQVADLTSDPDYPDNPDDAEWLPRYMGRSTG
jgi:hypothetical protein